MTNGKNGVEYNNESISALKGADRVRKRPGVIFGSDGVEGCQHSVFEILSNSVDEAREGYGDRIEITRFKDRSVEVKDYGRGIPLEYNENEKKFNWRLIFCELYAGGKYNNDAGQSYEYSLGLNGLGTCATQYASEYMSVEVKRDGSIYNLEFTAGSNRGGLKKEPYSGTDTGTKIKWRPDLKVFTDIDIPLEYFQNMLEKQSVVNAGLTFILHDEESGEDFTYCYENGLVDYIKTKAEDNALSSIQVFKGTDTGRDRNDKPEYKVKMEIAFCFSNKLDLQEYYHNSSFLEHGGSPERAVRLGFASIIDNELKKRNKYNKNESRISFFDIQDSLIIVTSSFSTITSYENQTKKAITNRFIQEAITNLLKKELEVYFIENREETDKILDQILINKRSRETAEKTRLNIKKKLNGRIDIQNRVKKFVNCRLKDPKKRELYIVEGDSALGACKLGRDAEFQAIIPVRGKILNCLKADYNSIFKNDIIVDLLKVMGCGVEIKTRHMKDFHTFDIEKLNYNKVIICTDADVDGFQIRTLILAMLYRLVPTLIKEGRVYIAETPLYEITSGKETLFAYSDTEKDKITKKLNGNTNIQRSKGLGENEPDMMWLTTMNPETRRLIRVMEEDAQETEKFFDLLLGDNLQGRKDYIRDHGHEYLEMVDIS
jgi:DNA gyrase subunit B